MFLLKPDTFHDGGKAGFFEVKDPLVGYILLFSHILAYGISFFREWDKANNGKLDVNGVLRGQNESFLTTVQIFIDCLIFGYILNHFTRMPSDSFHENTFYHYWILIDCILMFFTYGYRYLTMAMQI